MKPISRIVTDFVDNVDTLDNHSPLIVDHDLEEKCDKALAILNKEFSHHPKTSNWKLGYSDDEGEVVALSIGDVSFTLRGTRLWVGDTNFHTRNEAKLVTRLMLMILRYIKDLMNSSEPLKS